ncbi:MAG: DM13 domain-containing protein, partial [Acidimicrobiales bacterium]
MTDTQTPPSLAQHAPTDGDGASSWDPSRLIGRVTTAEWVVAGIVAVVMLALTLLEPDVLEAPIENTNTIVFTVGGTILAAIALVLLLRFGVPPVVRIVVLLVPFVIVNWWLLSPFFLDDVVDEEFSTSIAAQLDGSEAPTTPVTTEGPGADEGSSGTEAPEAPETPDAPVDEAPAGPVLLGAGTFVGLAGHSGTGDAGLFQDVDGSRVLRFENFDIENGPDLEVYLVPGADQTSLATGSVHLGALKGNVGDQTYELPAGTELAPGPYTALVWCEAFAVEFVG